MLSRIDLSRKMDKKAYKDEIDVLEEKMESLGQAVKEAKIPVIIVFEGWSASGKGTLISRVVHPLDPRCFNVYTMDKLTEESVMRPFLWRYWIKTPAKGRFAIFDKSWHRIILPEGISKSKLSETEKDGFFYDVDAFERQLADDGALIIKFFLHIDKDEQKKRFRELEKNPATRWHVDEDDWKQNNEYDKYLEIFNNLLERTNSESWTIVEANDKRYATVKILGTIIERISEKLKTVKEINEQPEPAAPIVPAHTTKKSILAACEPKKEFSDNEYKKYLEEYQKNVSELVYLLYTIRKSVVIVYEGWDAAGKGGNIKRLTEDMDPRGYEVVPIMAPSAEELSHHYLWRFYNKLPKDGHIGIFDRSWYGRVLVERVEGLCRPGEWMRAYNEINEMERHWANHGVIFFKFWMNIDKDEQLRRFKNREENPLKQHKITDEDWRNREKWDIYEDAVVEMIEKTSTDYAPWTVIESNDKKYARIRVLKLVSDELRSRLQKNPH